MKFIIRLLIVVCIGIILYGVLSYMGIVPTRHCDSMMGPGAPGTIYPPCEWYSGPDRIY